MILLVRIAVFKNPNWHLLAKRFQKSPSANLSFGLFGNGLAAWQKPKPAQRRRTIGINTERI
jgi:hypothetical protein